MYWIDKNDPDVVRIYGEPTEVQSGVRRCTKCRGFKKSSLDLTGVPDQMRDADIYKFDFSLYGRDMTKFKDIAFSLFNDYKRWAEEGRGLYICSTTPGSGKTFLACCISKSIMMKYNIRMKFITAVDYIAKVGDSYSAKKNGMLDDFTEIYRECEVLILDDIGTQLKNDWQNQELFRLVNERVNRGLITIYTSNFPIEKLSIDERIKNRLYGSTIELAMPEVSVRANKAREANNNFLKSMINDKEQKK